MRLEVLAPEGERLWTLHAVRVPAHVDEAAVRRDLRERFDIEVGAGIGPLAGRVWRIGLMGASSTPAAILLLVAALEQVLPRQHFPVPAGAGTAAALRSLASA
jgi:alanine-glyoxylate transaminase/serine-glyoxylate transaminase/serine-pyruvate transaminase